MMNYLARLGTHETDYLARLGYRKIDCSSILCALKMDYLATLNILTIIQDELFCHT